MSARTPRRNALAPLVIALALLSPSGCAPEVTMCQVDGARMGTTLYLNPVIYTRVYGADPLDGTPTITVVDASGRTVNSAQSRDILVEPGGAYMCFYRAGASPGSGIGPFDISTLGPLTGLTVRVTITDRSGATQTVSMPVGRIRAVDQLPPSFDCGSTHCGR